MKRLIFACAIALMAAAPADAVELGPLTAQINGKADSVAAIDQVSLVDLEDGGFAALWSRFEGVEAQSLFARFFKADAKPDGKELRYDGKVVGETADFNTPTGGVRIGGGRMLAVWGAQFAENSAEDPRMAGQVFDDGKRDGKLKPLARPAIRPFRAVQLRDGRALLAWLPYDRLDRGEGGFVEASGAVKRPFVKLSPDGEFLEEVAALDKGFISAFQYIDERDRDHTDAQVYDADGRKVGGPFEIVPPRPLFALEGVGIIGLASGGFVVLSAEDGSEFLAVDIYAQVFGRNRKPTTKRVKLATNVPAQQMWSAGVAVGKSDIVLALEEGEPFGKVELVFRRYDDTLKQVGPAARTKKLDGLRRGGVKLLSDGRVAAVYDLFGEKLFVQIATP